MSRLLKLLIFALFLPSLQAQDLDQILQYDDRGYLIRKTEVKNLPDSKVEFRDFDPSGQIIGRRILTRNGRGKPERLELFAVNTDRTYKTEVYEPDYANSKVLINTWLPGESSPVRTTVYYFKNKLLEKVTITTPERGVETLFYEQIRSVTRWETIQKDREGFITFDEYWEREPSGRVLWGIRRDGPRVERLDISYQDKRIDITSRSGSKIYTLMTYLFAESLEPGQPLVYGDLPGPNNLVLWEHFF